MFQKSNVILITKKHVEKIKDNVTNSDSLRETKSLGGNAGDGWIWKGKLPQSTTIPSLPKPSQSPFVTNRLPVNHTEILTTLNVESNEKDFTNKFKGVISDEHELLSNAPHDFWIWRGSTVNPKINFTSEVITLQKRSSVLPSTEVTELWGENSTVSSILLKNDGIPTINEYSIPQTTSEESILTSEETFVTEEFINQINTTILSWSSTQSLENIVTAVENATAPAIYQSGQGVDAMEYTNVDEGLNYSPSSVVFIGILVVLLIFSVIGNALILFTILCRHYLRQTFFLLYVSLATSDLLASILSVPVLILAILYPFSLPQEFCIFITIAVVLTTFISVGSIATLSSIRWWQFYNFIQTRTHEKRIIRFVIFALWVIGFGIIFGFLSRDIFELKSSCSLSFVTTILQKTLPFTSISIFLGLITIIIFNYLTISKIKKKSIYTNDQLSPTHATSHFSKLMALPPNVDAKGNENSDLNFRGNNNGPTKHLENTPKPRRRFLKGNYSKTTKTNGGKKYGKRTMSNRHYELQKNPLQSMPQKLEPWNVQGQLKTQLPASESELESEHLYQVIEPKDTQEHLLSSTQIQNNRKSLEPRIILPNAVENIYNIHPETLKHETTIVMESSPPTKHSVNTNAWKLDKMYDFLPKKYLKYEGKRMGQTQTQGLKLEGDFPEQVPSTLSPWPLLQSPLAMKPSNPSRCANSLCLEIDKLRELPNSSQENLITLPTSFPLMEMQDSLCAGYMADLSAPSSKHSTPHRKSRKKRPVHRNSLKVMSYSTRPESAIESDEEVHNNEVVNNSSHQVLSDPSKSGPSSRYYSGSGVAAGKNNDTTEGFAMHPVRQKCIRTSHRLIALYSLAYLPLLLLQMMVLITTHNTLVLVTLTYMVFLLTIHPSLYGLQSPILKNAIRKSIRKLFRSQPKDINKEMPFPMPSEGTPPLTAQMLNSNHSYSAFNTTVKPITRPSSVPSRRPRLPTPIRHSRRPSSHPVSSSHALNGDCDRIQ